MADFPAITHTTLVSLFSDIASAIRAKKGISAEIIADEFPSEIMSIPSGGAVTPEDKNYSVSNQAIEEFVENVNYTADYSTSSVGTYTAKPYADGGRPKGANVNIKGGTLHQLDNGNDYTKTVAEGATTIYNNTPDTVGAYSVVNDGNVVSYGKLMPSGNVRIIKCDGIVNMRDLGGWAADGGTVRYGKLFRSPALDNATTADISMMSNLLGINSELDMRESGAEGGGSSRFENYLHQPMGNYADIIATDAYKAKSKTAFEFVMNCAIQGKPCVFHCAAGADRTGTMAWVLLGVLGVSQSDCDKEYEITSFSTPTRLRTTYLPALYSAVAALDGDTFAEKCKSVLVECGIEVAIINQFRHAMIDGTPTDFEDTADMREEMLASLKACTRMKWSNSTTSSKAPTNNNGWLALATTSGDTWQFTDRESNTCYGIKIPSWATKIVVSTTDASIIKWSFRSYLADGTAVGIADEDNTSGKYAVSNAEVIQISACYSTDGSVTPSWNYDSTKISVKFVGYGGITPSGSVTLTEENTYDVTDKASAIVDFSATRANLAEAVTAKGVDTLPTSSFDTIAANIGLIEGRGGVVKGNFTVSEPYSVGLTVNHNAGIKGDYLFVAWMRADSFEALAKTVKTQDYVVGFIYCCTSGFHDLSESNTRGQFNKQGLRWYYKPSTAAHSLSASAIKPVTSYTANQIVSPPNFGYHAGTYDFWVIPI